MSKNKVNVVPMAGFEQPQRVPLTAEQKRAIDTEYNSASRCNETLGVSREDYHAVREGQESQ